MDRVTCMLAFTKAVDLGSFASAAEALQASPQWVGKCVKSLEQHLGVRLLHRSTRRQSLTELGRSYYERARGILAEVEAADSLAAASRATPRGRIRINAPVTFGIHALSPRIPEYLAKYPEVSVELTLGNRIVDLVDEGFDAVFRVGKLPDSGLVARALAPYRLILCAAPSYLKAHGTPRTPADLTKHECLMFAHTSLSTHWEFNGPAGRIRVPVRGRMMADSGEALLSAARSGLGLLLQPAELVQADLAAGRLQPVMPRYRVPARPLRVLHASDARMTPKLRSFLDFVAAAFRREIRYASPE